MLTDADDDFHEPTTDEPTWAETAWFAARVPDRNLVLWFYPLFRRQLGVMSCAVYLFGSGYHELWEVPYYRTYWHMPIPDGIRACDFELPNGLSYRTVEPLQAYGLRYRDEDILHVDLSFTGIHPAHPFGVEHGRGHIDQLGRLEGTITLHGERMAVDSIEMRDRTWSPRRESRQNTRLGYSYGAASATDAFHCSTRFATAGEQVFMTGFRLGPSGKTDLTDARREVERDERGRPVTIHLSLGHPDGVEEQVHGEVTGLMTMYTTPYVVWVSVVRWTLPDGSVAWGEDQDTWSPGRLRGFLRDGGYMRA